MHAQSAENISALKPYCAALIPSSIAQHAFPTRMKPYGSCVMIPVLSSFAAASPLQSFGLVLLFVQAALALDSAATKLNLVEAVDADAAVAICVGCGLSFCSGVCRCVFLSGCAAARASRAADTAADAAAALPSTRRDHSREA